MNYLQDTPIESYIIQGKEIFVKREDLACLPPGPPFAKVRGLLPTLTRLKEEGIQTAGYMETTVSMACWGISYFCKILEMQSIIFYPQHKDKILRENQQYQFEKCKEFDAKIVPLENPNRLSINFYRARKLLKEKEPKGYMLPQGLPFEETKYEVAKQVELFDQEYKSIVICTGSGTMAAGVLIGLSSLKMKTEVFGILCSRKDPFVMHKKILKASNLLTKNPYDGFNLLKSSPFPKLFITDKGYEYTEREEIECPFPSNKYYDRKAWAWLLKHIDELKQPILFWNIGSDYTL